MAYMDEFYFESAAMILTLITVGKLLEARSKGKTTDALKSLMALAPETATVIRDGKEVKIPAAQVRKGDVFVVRPGQSIPVDGVVLDGASAVNEAALTGESVPVDKAPGDGVSRRDGQLLGLPPLRGHPRRRGYHTQPDHPHGLRCGGDESADCQDGGQGRGRVRPGGHLHRALSQRSSGCCWAGTFCFALARGISVLVISCPCALGLATPVAIMVGSGVGAKNGILFKTAASLEHTGRTRIVALDKTGTITSGQPEVTDLIPADGVTERELLQAAVSLEAKSEHPLAAAIMKRGEEEKLQPEAAENFAAMHRQRSDRDGTGRAAARRQRQISWPRSSPCRRTIHKQADALLASRQDAAAVRRKTADFSASSPWRTPSSRTARRPSGSCATWASAS